MIIEELETDIPCDICKTEYATHRITYNETERSIEASTDYVCFNCMNTKIKQSKEVGKNGL